MIAFAVPVCPSCRKKKCCLQLIRNAAPVSAFAARKLLDEYNVSYTVIMASDDLDEHFPVNSLPTSVFVGPDGTILAEPVIGARVERYHTILNELSRR